MTLNNEAVRRILPHKEPLLLIDRAKLPGDGSVQAEVDIRPDWEIFRGHFPGRPILPAVYLTEAMAQAADLALLTMPGNERKLPLFLGIIQMRFLRPVFPGDRLLLSAKTDCDAGNGIYDCTVSASVSNKRAASGRISLALKDREE